MTMTVEAVMLILGFTKSAIETFCRSQGIAAQAEVTDEQMAQIQARKDKADDGFDDAFGVKKD